MTNFPVVDAIVPPYTGYQMTVSSTHAIAEGDLLSLVGALGCNAHRRFRLVWVVPLDVDFQCHQLSASLASVVEQWVLKLPLRVPPAPQHSDQPPAKQAKR